MRSSLFKAASCFLITSVSQVDGLAREQRLDMFGAPVDCNAIQYCPEDSHWSKKLCQCKCSPQKCEYDDTVWSQRDCECVPKLRTCAANQYYSSSKDECVCKPIPCVSPLVFSPDDCMCVASNIS